MKNKPAVMIAAPKSGSGKTLVTCALLSALKDRGMDVCSIKAGPDYIDPLFHKEIIGTKTHNLDTFFTDESTTREIFNETLSNCDFALVEGVMGLFDGVGGVEMTGSSYDLARVLSIPVILVVDTKGSARSAIPLVKGFLDYDNENLISGIVFNNMSKDLFLRMKPLFEKEIPVPVLGFIPRDENLSIKSRYLGLCLPDEIEGIKKTLNYAKNTVSKSVDIEKIIEIANRDDGGLFSGKSFDGKTPLKDFTEKNKVTNGSVNIAVAKDRAFCFYYEENLWLLRQLGAKITFFSPIKDSEIPKGVNGIIFGGGYPELFAKELSENISMLKSVKAALFAGLPILAECGGFMYLHEAIETAEKNKYKMVGYIPGKAFYCDKKIRFGYGEYYEKNSHFMPHKECIKGHEFHYFDSENPGSFFMAKKASDASELSCIHSDERSVMGFPHFYYPSKPEFAAYFVKMASKRC